MMRFGTAAGILGLAAALSTSALLTASSARADSFAFGGSNYVGDNVLTLGTSGGPVTVPLAGSNGIDTFGVSQGWWSNLAGNNNTNTNYITGYLNIGSSIFRYNDFFIFDISGLTPDVTSATLTLNGFTITDPLNFRLGGVSIDIPTLENVSAGPSSAIYAALASGPLYGTFPIGPGQSGSDISFALNSTAVAALNAAINGEVSDFEIGGSVNASATPLPATWTMMLIGLAGLGFVGYRQRRKPASAAVA